jgi:carboxylesterase type B
MWSLNLLILFFATVVAAQTGLSSSTVTVVDSTRNVTFVGAPVQGTEVFQGINYGQDTSGNNRFKPPRAFTYPVGSTIQATAAGAACPQNTAPAFLGISEPAGVNNISEDCLNLKIVRPAGTKANANLPVLVWVIGEGDETGSYNTSLYDPTALISSSVTKHTPTIFVSFNYRVNVFGFANSPAIAADKGLNAGLLDQRLALDWINANIAAFGGNRLNVTLFGESDGAVSCGLHLVSKGGNGKIMCTI